MIKLYNKKKNDYLKRINDTIRENFIYDYPSIWRRNFVKDIERHISLALIYLILILILLFLVFYSNVADSYNVILISIVSVAPLVFGVVPRLESTRNAKLPIWGFFDIKEEFIIVVINAFAKSYILIYPLIFFNILYSYAKPVYTNQVKKEITEYVNLFVNKSSSDGSSAHYTQLNQLVKEKLNLTKEEKNIVVSIEENKRSANITEIDSLIVKQINRLNRFSFNHISKEDYMSPKYMIRYFNEEMNPNNTNRYEIKQMLVLLLKLSFFLLCFFSYLEIKFYGVLAKEYLSPFSVKVGNILIIPLIIISIPFMAALISDLFDLKFAEAVTDFAWLIYDNYISPFLNILWKLIVGLFIFLGEIIFPLFIFTSFALIFLKKHLINLSLKPK